jgi:hypothetical protein
VDAHEATVGILAGNEVLAPRDEVEDRQAEPRGHRVAVARLVAGHPRERQVKEQRLARAGELRCLTGHRRGVESARELDAEPVRRQQPAANGFAEDRRELLGVGVVALVENHLSGGKLAALELANGKVLVDLDAD